VFRLYPSLPLVLSHCAAISSKTGTSSLGLPAII
jgi:hypothetical protein